MAKLKYSLIVVLLIALCAGCGFTKISLTKEKPTDTSLRLDGYYYGESEYNSGIDIFLFYEDGAMFLWATKSKDDYDLIEIDRLLKLLWSKYYTKSHASWGLFQIDNKDLQFEYWSNKEKRPSKFKTKLWKGEIMNDTTFTITSVYNNYQKKEYKLSNEYHFRQFSPKPDSTNTFIK